MSSAISGLRLYDYQGRYQVAQNLDVNRTVRIPQTEFSPELALSGLNSQKSVPPVNQVSYGLNTQGQITESPSAQLESLLKAGAKIFQPTGNLSYQAVTDPYRDYVNALEVSDQNMGQLLQRDQFAIFNGRLGLNVKTDGEGNIDKVSIQPGSKDLRNGTPVNATTFPDRAEITFRAADRQANALPPIENLDNTNPNNSLFIGKKRPNQFDPQPLQNDGLQFRKERLTLEPADISALRLNKPLSEVQVPDAPTNPLLQRLLRLQPAEVDTRIFGPDSQLTADQAKKLGAVNASLGVRHSDGFYENMALLRDRLAMEANQALPQRIAKARESSMPVNPFLQMEQPAQQAVYFGSPSQFLDSASTSADTMQKKSSGGYIPFQMGGEGSPQQQQRRQREPLFALA